jgi:hypothetical protein
VAEHRERWQLFGEFLREAAVLIFVLYPLEAYLDGKFKWWLFLVALALAMGFLIGGLILEGQDEA